MTIYDLKPKFQGLLRPLSETLARRGITANEITILALLISVGGGVWILLSPHSTLPLLSLPLLLFVRMALNAIDGMLAREHNMESSLGAILNELGDVVADAALYLPLALIPGVPAAALTVFVVLSTMTEMAGVVAVQVGTSRRYDGPLGKSDRAFAMGGLALALGLGLPTGLWLDAGLWILNGLAVATVVNRCRAALNEGGSG